VKTEEVVAQKIEAGVFKDYSIPLVKQKEPLYGWVRAGLWYTSGYVIPKYMHTIFMVSSAPNKNNRLQIRSMHFAVTSYVQSVVNNTPYVLDQSRTINSVDGSLLYAGLSIGAAGGHSVYGFDRSLDAIPNWSDALLDPEYEGVTSPLDVYRSHSTSLTLDANEFGMMWEMSGHILSVGQFLFPEYASPVAIKAPSRCAYCASPNVSFYFERPEMKQNPHTELKSLCQEHAPPKTRAAFVGLSAQDVGDMMNLKAVGNPEPEAKSEGTPAEQEGVAVDG
jgi:hypothetical protein